MFFQENDEVVMGIKCHAFSDFVSVYSKHMNLAMASETFNRPKIHSKAKGLGIK